jgi:hypothetical protein
MFWIYTCMGICQQKHWIHWCTATLLWFFLFSMLLAATLHFSMTISKYTFIINYYLSYIFHWLFAVICWVLLHCFQLCVIEDHRYRELQCLQVVLSSYYVNVLALSVFEGLVFTFVPDDLCLDVVNIPVYKEVFLTKIKWKTDWVFKMTLMVVGSRS